MPIFLPTYRSQILNTLDSNYAKAIYVDEIFNLPVIIEENAIYIFRGKRTRRGNYALKIFNYKLQKFMHENKKKEDFENFLKKNKIELTEDFIAVKSIEEFNAIQDFDGNNFILEFLFDSCEKLFYDENKKLCIDYAHNNLCTCCSNEYLQHLKKTNCMNHKVLVSMHNYKLFFK